jgi:deoxycytidine triphosphate deaminase
MIFSTTTIFEYIKEGKIKIEPFDSTCLKEASYTLKLNRALDIPARGFVLGTSLEKITLSSTVAGLISTKSSIARRGIDVAQSSSFCSPETDNAITFEIVNHTEENIHLEEGEAVAKMIFMEIK